MEHTTVAVDLAKSVFQVAVSHRPGHLDEERRLARDRFFTFFAQRPPATIMLEPAGPRTLGSPTPTIRATVRLLPPHDVRPYVRRNKTDRTDAKGLLEANRNEEIHPVPVKTIEHQAIASLHRLRSTWLATRTARLNTLRGLLREFGIFIPVGSQRVVPRVRALVEEPAVPGCCTRRSPQPATRSRCSRRTCMPSNGNSRRWRPRCRMCSCCKPSPAWASSPRPRSSRSSPISVAFPQAGILPAFSA